MRFEHGTNFTEGVTNIAPLKYFYDATANDSDKSFVVPAGETWKLTQAYLTLVTTAAVGNRQIRFTATDADGNLIGYISSGAVQAASLTRSYGFLQGIYRETSFIDGMIQIPIPCELFMPPGSTLRFWDSAAIAAGADDLTVAFTVQVFKGV